MSDAPQPTAEFRRCGERMEAVMTRLLEHPPGRVWAALTDSAVLPQWLAAGRIEPREGGAVRLDFGDSGVVVDSQVVAWRPGALLAYDWSGPNDPARPLRWVLEPIDGWTRLTLTLTAPADEDAGRACAGWEAHLEMLAAALEGVPIKFPFEHFKALRDAYRAHLAAAPA